MASDLVTLAKRCEAATGPDREIDARIAHAICWRWDGWNDGDLRVEERDLEWFIDRVLHSTNSIFRYTPSYTASLDAAMTLVPEGWAWTLYSDASCEIGRHPERGCMMNAEFITESTTPALALTAAALCAIDALRSQDKGEG